MRDGYKVGSDVSVSLEFRTSQSEGVFLGISSAKIDAIGLEMINGQVSRFYVCVKLCILVARSRHLVGICNIVLEWLRSYLADRPVCVSACL